MIDRIIEIGKPIELGLAIAVYMIAVWIVTEMLKPLLKFKGWLALGLSWVVGGLLFWMLFAVGCYAVSWASGILFVIVTGLCNGTYKWTGLKGLLRRTRREVFYD